MVFNSCLTSLFPFRPGFICFLEKGEGVEECIYYGKYCPFFQYWTGIYEISHLVILKVISLTRNSNLVTFNNHQA